MTHSFTFPELVPDLGQGELPEPNMMPATWNQTAASDLSPTGDAMLEKPGQKRRRETALTLQAGALIPNDSVPERSGNSSPTGGNNCAFGDDLEFAAHDPALANETVNFWDRIIHNTTTIPLTRVETVDDHQQNYNNSFGATQVTNNAAWYRSQIQHPANSRSSVSATALAVANFHARIDENRRSSSSAISQAYTVQGYPSAPNFRPLFTSDDPFESLSDSVFGGSSSNYTVNAATNWPNLTCQTSVNRFESTFMVQPQSPCTPRGHQSTELSDGHQQYLQHMERMNATLADPESPHQNSSRGRRLVSYVEHSQSEQPASGHNLLNQGFESASHMYMNESSLVPELAGFSTVDHVQLEVGCSQSFIEPAPVILAPAEKPNVDRFDLNEVPVGFKGDDAATPPKPSRKKYHPKVAKDKRTYKRRVVAKKVNDPVSPLDGMTGVNSIKRKARKAGMQGASNQTQLSDSTNESNSEGMDMDVESNGHSTNCDCEACIKLRLEKSQSPVSPEQQQLRSRQFSDPGSSPPVRRSLTFQAPDGQASGATSAFLCLSQQICESAARLERTQRELLHLQNRLSSAIVSANPSPSASNNPTVCTREILSPQPVSFRDMNQVQRVVYLRSVLKSHSLKMSPEELHTHIHDHLPESEKSEFKDALWPVVVGDLTDEKEKQLREFAQLEERADAIVEVVKVRKGPGSSSRVKKPHPNMATEIKEGGGGRTRRGKEIIDDQQLAMVPYENNNKSVVPYSGPFNPLRKKKNRAKVVLDDETVRVWKLLMGGKAGNDQGTETDAENELKWEDERRKMKAQAQTFIERMHIVIGDRSFSKWKGSVVDSVVGAFLTQNVNDVLSSSAFMSMRSRFPPKPSGSAGTANFESGVQQQHPISPSPPTQAQNISAIPSPLESHYGVNLAGAAFGGEGQPPGPSVSTDLQTQKDGNLQMSNVVLTEEGIQVASTTEIEVVSTEKVQPSHGKNKGKAGMTGLERAKIEEKQVTASKHFDFSGLQEEFKPGKQRPPAPARTEATEDGVDWEAVRRADVAEVADVIKERGLNWILAGRIKAFLERIHLDYGQLDLEWLRSMSTDQTKDFLLSIHGLGLKSVECIRLLTLHHLAFPVDTNVGRICVRLGWVPLEPLPEELQLHLLELYPMQATIQKYLWPRLCKFDHKTLYELHYQMISFGKVFCTKTKPNCNACPMRSECKHFASAVSSAKLALPASEQRNSSPTTTLALPPGETVTQEFTSRPVSQYCSEPIIEEPMTPESDSSGIEVSDIEDYPFSVQELIENTLAVRLQNQAATVFLSEPAHTVTLPDTEPVPEPVPEALPESTDWGGLAAAATSSVSKGKSFPNNSVTEIVDLDNLENPSALVANTASQAIVAVATGTASLPVPKLKKIGRLRTIHYVYVLPDNHPLLDGLDPRESDDPCTYLLAIWGSDEVPETIPNTIDSVNEENGPFASSSSKGEETVRATLLVPCRTAMRGSFPLNGTYFQTNEVFADHASSLQPMLVPRTLLWNLRRRFVYFGTSVTSIFKGMADAEVQACFWSGYVCVRGFDRLTKAPKPLVGRLHLQASKAKGVNADA